ncbi:MAG: ketopantoate reductase family protein [Chloroflexota bacterium]
MRDGDSPAGIGVLGAGAMGSLFAGLLALSGHPALLLARPSRHVDAIRDGGLRVREPGETDRTAHPAIATDPAAVAGVSALIVLVKAWATGEAVSAVAPWLAPDCLVVTLQNGLGNREEILRNCPGHDPGLVVAGVTSEAALSPEPGAVTHTGRGWTAIEVGPDVAALRVAALCGALTAAGLPASPEPAMEAAIWRKLAVNAAINGVTALAGVNNGAILDDPALLEISLRAGREVAAVARLAGVACGDVERAIIEVARATSANRASLHRDLDTGRRPERDAIYGAVARAARALHAEVPVCETLGALVGARERAAFGTSGEANR